VEYFRPKPGSFSEISKALFYRTIPIMLLAFAVAFLITEYKSGFSESSVKSGVAMFVFMIVAGGAGVLFSMKTQKAKYESYELGIGEELITRTQYSTPSMSLKKGDVKGVVKNSNGSYSIKGIGGMLDVIGVPAQIENSERLEVLLNGFAPIQIEEKPSLFTRFQYVFIVGGLALFGAVFTSTNKIVVSISGGLIVALIIYNLVVLNKSKNIDKSMKMVSRVSLILLFSVVMTVYWKVWG
jgi:hypothetical protein